MTQVTIPTGYQQVMPYLILRDASAFEAFMKSVFNATEKDKHMRDGNTIMHAEIRVGESTIMFADSNEEWSTTTGGFFIYVENADEVYAKALEEGATVVTEIKNMDYGRSGGVKDPFGNVWWITSVIDQ